MTPGLNEGCKNAVSRPVKYVPRSTALQTANVIEGIQRVKREVIVGAGWSRLEQFSGGAEQAKTVQ